MKEITARRIQLLRETLAELNEMGTDPERIEALNWAIDRILTYVNNSRSNTRQEEKVKEYSL